MNILKKSPDRSIFNVVLKDAYDHVENKHLIILVVKNKKGLIIFLCK
jgi:hypothetical protein